MVTITNSKPTKSGTLPNISHLKCDKQVASLNCSAPISRVETGCLNLLFRQQ